MDPELLPERPIREVMAELRQWNIEHSKPKVAPQPPTVDRGPRGIPSSDFLNRMATGLPRFKYVKPSKDPTTWIYRVNHLVKQSALDYVISSRVNEMATPKYMYIKPSDDETCWAYKVEHLVKPSALTYEANETILELATPKYHCKKWKKKRARFVKKSALKGKASARVVSLSKPRAREVPKTKEHVFDVNPIALKYVATRRIKMLARPKPLITKIKERSPKTAPKKPKKK